MDARGGIHSRCITLPLLCAPLQLACHLFLVYNHHVSEHATYPLLCLLLWCSVLFLPCCCVLQCEQTQDNKGCTTVGVCGKTPEVAGLQVRPEAAVCSALRCARPSKQP
jgi:hypothetical protein